MLTFTISPSDHCRRVESFLYNLLPTAQTGYVHKLIRSGHLTVNGQNVAADTLLLQGDSISLKESKRTGELLAHRTPMVDILYEDDRLLVLNKPPGIPVHMSAEDGDRNLVNLAERFMMWRGTVVKLRPINRLDKGTSGAVLLAKSATSAGMFGRFVKEEGLGKVYLAVASGKLDESGVIDIPLDGKESETSYRLLIGTEERSLTVVYPKTGRMHQIRKHLNLIGHPIMGDRRYGGPPLPGCHGFGLHALLVSLHHPELKKELTIMAPLPEGLIRIFSQLDISGEAFSSLPSLLPVEK